MPLEGEAEVVRRLARPHLVGAVFDRLHVVIRQAEMVADFVDQTWVMMSPSVSSFSAQ